jgi:prepilin-type N-terminal cleavage/methylation domain-containing protein
MMDIYLRIRKAWCARGSIDDPTPGNSGGFTLVEMMIAGVIFAILISMIFVIITNLMTQSMATTRNLSAQDAVATVSNSLARDIREATYPPSSSASPPPAVWLVCPDAMVLYSNLPTPSGASSSSQQGWLYIYLTKEDTTVPAVNGVDYWMYTLHVDIVGYGSTPNLEVGTTPITGPASDGTSTSWSADCGGAASSLLTSDTVQESAPPARTLIDMRGLYGPSPASWSTTPGSGPSPLFTYFESYQTSAATGNAVHTVYVTFSSMFRDLSCTVCTSKAVLDSPSSTLSSSTLLANVALNNGFGAGNY